MKNGIFILSGWFLFNALPGVGSLLYILMGRHAPAFQYLFRQEELAALDSKFINTTDGVAIIANVVIVSYCFSSFFIVIKCLAKREIWSFFVLAGGIVMVQAASYWSDSKFSGQNVWIIHFSSVVFLTGLGLVGKDLFEKRSNL